MNIHHFLWASCVNHKSKKTFHHDDRMSLRTPKKPEADKIYAVCWRNRNPVFAIPSYIVMDR